jgi:hypothetical protein
VKGRVERLPRRRAARVLLAADEVGLPRRHARDAGRVFDLAHGRHRIGGLGCRCDQHQIDLVGHDQLARHVGGAIGIGLAVLDHDLDRIAVVADLEAAAHRVGEIRDHEIVGLGEGRERPGLRADIAELQGLGGADRRREYGTGGKPRAARQRAFDQRAPVERQPEVVVSMSVLTRASSHGKPPLFHARRPGLMGRCSDLN